jgi:hypothetical protein
MTDDATQPNPSDQTEPSKPEQSGEAAQQPQAGVPVPDAPAAQPSQRATPGRRPLFRS